MDKARAGNGSRRTTQSGFPNPSASRSRHSGIERSGVIVPKRPSDGELAHKGEGRTNGLNRRRPRRRSSVKPDLPQPWERKPAESPQAYRAFTAYRDQEPADRTAVQAARIVGISTPLVHRWSRRHSWLKRAAEFDAHLDVLRFEQSVHTRLEMHKRHSDAGKQLLAVAVTRVARLKPAELTPRDLSAFVRTGVEVERIARGETQQQSEAFAPRVNIDIQWGTNVPSWIRRDDSANPAPTVVVTSGEKVLAGTNSLCQRVQQRSESNIRSGKLLERADASSPCVATLRGSVSTKAATSL
jgi:hypothetical protein